MNGNRQEGIGRSGLYVDMENLQSEGQSMVQSLIENWPDKVPAATRLTLYVRADQTELWRLWATSQFTNMEVVVHGTQHFSMSSTKNSADIAIAASAIADLLLKRVSHVVVFSDDSDSFLCTSPSETNQESHLMTVRHLSFGWSRTGREHCRLRSGSFSRRNFCTWWRPARSSQRIVRYQKPPLKKRARLYHLRSREVGLKRRMQLSATFPWDPSRAPFACPSSRSTGRIIPWPRPAERNSELSSRTTFGLFLRTGASGSKTQARSQSNTR